MDLKEIKALLEKYYNGETSLEEEKILKEYFSKDRVDPELIADKDIFMYQIQEDDQLQDIPDISDQIWYKLNKTDSYKVKNNNKIAYLFLRIAASAILLFGLYFVVKDQVFSSKNNMVITDTYNDPEEAYKQAKETLLYVSAMLNTGTNHLEPIQKINEGTQKLYTLSSFNNGLKELEPISKYNKANKYFKQ